MKRWRRLKASPASCPDVEEYTLKAVTMCVEVPPIPGLKWVGSWCTRHSRRANSILGKCDDFCGSKENCQVVPCYVIEPVTDA
jgi:hypothetical protein